MFFIVNDDAAKMRTIHIELVTHFFELVVKFTHLDFAAVSSHMPDV
jgi:hypothetical protein